jgi:adenosylhomocysteine nucleosidase
MPDLIKTALVAALEREVRPLLKRWKGSERAYEGRRFRFFESAGAVLVCGGIGAAAARRATEAVISLYQPMIVMSIGFAGALEPSFRVGDVFIPRRVFDTSDGSSLETGEGTGMLITLSSVASLAQKSKLAAAYRAQAVDMEAAAVGRGAQARGIAFTAVKAISDEADFEMPSMERFIEDGRFLTAKFVAWNAVRPWRWLKVIKVARNASRASDALCEHLAQVLTPSSSERSDLAAAGSQKQS